MTISASEQVKAWLRALPPSDQTPRPPCHPGLARNRGNIKALAGPLGGFNRLRVGGLRIIYRQSARDVIQLEFANTREVVYKMYEQILSQRRRED